MTKLWVGLVLVGMLAVGIGQWTGAAIEARIADAGKPGPLAAELEQRGAAYYVSAPLDR